MAFKIEPYTGPPEPIKYVYQRHPLNLYRNGQVRQAMSQEDEDEALACGWTTQTPAPKAPTPEFQAPVSLEERINKLQAEVDALQDTLEEIKSTIAGILEQLQRRGGKQPKAEEAKAVA